MKKPKNRVRIKKLPYRSIRFDRMDDKGNKRIKFYSRNKVVYINLDLKDLTQLARGLKEAIDEYGCISVRSKGSGDNILRELGLVIK